MLYIRFIAISFYEENTCPRQSEYSPVFRLASQSCSTWQVAALSPIEISGNVHIQLSRRSVLLLFPSSLAFFDFGSRQFPFNMTKLNDICHASPNGSMAEMTYLKPLDLLLSDKLVTVAAPMVRYSK